MCLARSACQCPSPPETTTRTCRFGWQPEDLLCHRRRKSYCCCIPSTHPAKPLPIPLPMHATSSAFFLPVAPHDPERTSKPHARPELRLFSVSTCVSGMHRKRKRRTGWNRCELRRLPGVLLGARPIRIALLGDCLRCPASAGAPGAGCSRGMASIRPDPPVRSFENRAGSG